MSLKGITLTDFYCPFLTVTAGDEYNSENFEYAPKTQTTKVKNVYNFS
jgi:hypothetical protein